MKKKKKKKMVQREENASLNHEAMIKDEVRRRKQASTASLYFFFFFFFSTTSSQNRHPSSLNFWFLQFPSTSALSMALFASLIKCNALLGVGVTLEEEDATSFIDHTIRDLYFKFQRNSLEFNYETEN